MVVLPRNKKFFSRLHWARLGVRKLDESEAEQVSKSSISTFHSQSILTSTSSLLQYNIQ